MIGQLEISLGFVKSGDCRAIEINGYRIFKNVHILLKGIGYTFRKDNTCTEVFIFLIGD